MSKQVEILGFFHSAGIMPTQSLIVTGYYDFTADGLPVFLNAEFGLVKPATKILLKQEAIRGQSWAN